MHVFSAHSVLATCHVLDPPFFAGQCRCQLLSVNLLYIYVSGRVCVCAVFFLSQTVGQINQFAYFCVIYFMQLCQDLQFSFHAFARGV